jgi:hypothetical protein
MGEPRQTYIPLTQLVDERTIDWDNQNPPTLARRGALVIWLTNPSHTLRTGCRA